MKHAFADFFTIRDCAKALKMHNDDIEEAAAWLCEQGEDPSVKWQIPRLSSIVLCESIVSSRWTENGQSAPDASAMPSYASYATHGKSANAISTNGEIHTSRLSVLHTSCIESGRWTICKNRKQITYHSLDTKGEVGVAYVFSMDPAHFKPLTGNAKELERLNKQHRESYNGLF